MPGAFSDWSPRDKALLSAALLATYADDQSTKGALKRGGQELNPIMGHNPSGSDLDTEALITSGLAASLAHGIPEKYRGAFLGGWTGLEGSLAAGNAKVGRSKGDPGPLGVLSGSLPAAGLGALAGLLLPSGLGDSTVGLGMVQGVPTLAYTRNF